MSAPHSRLAPDHVERYLRRLARWTPRRSRHDLVLEASRHLYEATCRAQAEGLTHEEAQRRAIRAFGPAWRIGLCARGLLDHPLLAAAFALIARLRGPRRLPLARMIRRCRRRGVRPRLF